MRGLVLFEIIFTTEFCFLVMISWILIDSFIILLGLSQEFVIVCNIMMSYAGIECGSVAQGNCDIHDLVLQVLQAGKEGIGVLRDGIF